MEKAALEAQLKHASEATLKVEETLVRMNQIMRSLDKILACVRCDVVGRFKPIALVGGYRVIMCLSCQNDWAAYVYDRPEFLTYRKSLKALEILANKNCEPLLIDLTVEQLVRSERDLFKIGRAWATRAEMPPPEMSAVPR